MKITQLIIALWCLLLSGYTMAQTITITSPAPNTVFEECDIVRIDWTCSPDIRYISFNGRYENNDVFGISFFSTTGDTAGSSYIFLNPDSILLAPRILEIQVYGYSNTGSTQASVFGVVNPALPSSLVLTLSDTVICHDAPVQLVPSFSGGTPPYTYSLIRLGDSYSEEVLCHGCNSYIYQHPQTFPYQNNFTGTKFGVRVEDATGLVGYDTMRINTRLIPQLLDTLSYNSGEFNWGLWWPCGYVLNPQLKPDTINQPQIVSAQWTDYSTGNVIANVLNPDIALPDGPSQFDLHVTDTYGCTTRWISISDTTFCDAMPVLCNPDCRDLNSPDSTSAGYSHFNIDILGNDVLDTNYYHFIEIRVPPLHSTTDLTYYGSGGSYWPVLPFITLSVATGNTALPDSFLYIVKHMHSNNVVDSAWVYINAPCPPPSGLVWPGDADNNGYVDNTDLLPIGVGYSATGPQRSGASINWVGQSCADWSDTLADGTNYKFIDCNGGGLINADDTLAIQQNFYLAHERSSDDEWRSNAPVLTINLLQDTLTGMDTLHTEIILGDVNLPASNVYGIAFDINFDANVVDTNHLNITYGNSWLGSTTDLLTLTRIFKNQGLIKTAVTRMDHTARSGHGVIAMADFLITTSNINGKDLAYYKSQFRVSKITMVDADGAPLEVNASFDSLQVEFEPTGINDEKLNKSIGMFPNPAKDMLTVISQSAPILQIRIQNLLGEEMIIQQTGNSGRKVIDVSGLSAGIYLVQIHTNAGVVTRKLMKE